MALTESFGKSQKGSLKSVQFALKRRFTKADLEDLMVPNTFNTAITKDYGKRVAIVTGSARGIGRAIAMRLAQDGFDVCVNDIAANSFHIAAVVAEIRSRGRNAIGHIADVSNGAEVEQLVATCVKKLGPLTVMVANAGIVQIKPMLEMTEADVRRTFDVNVMGVFHCYQAAAKQMIKQGSGGKILGASSIAGFKSAPLLAHYSASKFAVRAFTQATARELSSYKITVNAYAPGVVETQMWDMVEEQAVTKGGFQRGGEVMKRQQIASAPMGRASVPEDVAKCVSYLASPDSDYMTGQTLVIDGGIVMN